MGPLEKLWKAQLDVMPLSYGSSRVSFHVEPGYCQTPQCLTGRLRVESSRQLGVSSPLVFIPRAVSSHAYVAFVSCRVVRRTLLRRFRQLEWPFPRSLLQLPFTSRLVPSA